MLQSSSYRWWQVTYCKCGLWWHIQSCSKIRDNLHHSQCCSVQILYYSSSRSPECLSILWLYETVYMYQTLGFHDHHCLYYVCRLGKSLYGLKQAPCAWYPHFADFSFTIGFHHNASAHSLFIYRRDTNLAYILLYVDDIICWNKIGWYHIPKILMITRYLYLKNGMLMFSQVCRTIN